MPSLTSLYCQCFHQPPHASPHWILLCCTPIQWNQTSPALMCCTPQGLTPHCPVHSRAPFDPKTAPWEPWHQQVAELSPQHRIPVKITPIGWLLLLFFFIQLLSPLGQSNSEKTDFKQCLLLHLLVFHTCWEVQGSSPHSLRVLLSYIPEILFVADFLPLKVICALKETSTLS